MTNSIYRYLDLPIPASYLSAKTVSKCLLSFFLFSPTAASRTAFLTSTCNWLTKVAAASYFRPGTIAGLSTVLATFYAAWAVGAVIVVRRHRQARILLRELGLEVPSMFPKLRIRNRAKKKYKKTPLALQPGLEVVSSPGAPQPGASLQGESLPVVFPPEYLTSELPNPHFIAELPADGRQIRTSPALNVPQASSSGPFDLSTSSQPSLPLSGASPSPPPWEEAVGLGPSRSPFDDVPPVSASRVVGGYSSTNSSKGSKAAF